MTRSGDLYDRVLAKFEFEPRLEASNITIGVKDSGIVVLGGEVASYAEKRIAEEAVQTIYGVNAVVDELKVNLASPYIRSDVDIAKNVLNVLKWNFFVPAGQIKIIVDKGYLTLSGEVNAYYKKKHAQKAVQDVLGIIGISNNIIVKPEVQGLDIKNKILQEFERNVRIDKNNIQVEVDDGQVTLKGKVRNFDEDKEARVVAWSVPGVSSVIDRLLISSYTN